MISPEVTNLTPAPAANETTTSAPLARISPDTGSFNSEDVSPEALREAREAYEKHLADHPDEYSEIALRHDSEDASQNYKDKNRLFSKQRSRNEWRKVIDADNEDINPAFNTDPIDAIAADAEKVNSGELYPSQEILHDLGERALALEPLVDTELSVAQVEAALLRVVAVNPAFKDIAEAAISRIYEQRPQTTDEMKKVVQETVRKVAQVAANPDDYIDAEHIEGSVPAVDQILEEGNHLVMSRRITRGVLAKEWAEEDEQEKDKVSA